MVIDVIIDIVKEVIGIVPLGLDQDNYRITMIEAT